MHKRSSLPAPDADALAFSQATQALIAREIRAAGGWISFARYMELALYAPAQGYYSGGAWKFGAQGDFITAPELTPLFGATLARQAAEVMACSAPQVLEVGAGSGALAASVLPMLAQLGHVPERYLILELSGELRARQAQRLAALPGDLAARVQWLERLPEAFDGVVLGNEVLDAMPVHLARWDEVGILERGVALDDAGGFAWRDRPAEGAVLAAAQALPVQAPYLSELPLAATAWIRQWGRVLGRGALLLVDYGFPRHEYFHPQRDQGTLMCHYRHHAHSEPFHLPGLTDITAHVDFTGVAEAAVGAGLELAGYTGQAQFLFNAGLLEALAARGETDTAEYLRASNAVKMLTSPAEMGELFKVIALTRNLPGPLAGFARGDRRHTL